MSTSQQTTAERLATAAQRDFLADLGHRIKNSGDFEVGGLVLRAADSDTLTFWQATCAIRYAKNAASGFAVNPEGWEA